MWRLPIAYGVQVGKAVVEKGDLLQLTLKAHKQRLLRAVVVSVQDDAQTVTVQHQRARGSVDLLDETTIPWSGCVRIIEHDLARVQDGQWVRVTGEKQERTVTPTVSFTNTEKTCEEYSRTEPPDAKRMRCASPP